LLLDEPFSSLDSITRYKLQNELLQIVQEKKVTCIFVTHDLDEAVFLADAITLISSNQSSASISEEIHLSRPRDRLSLEFANEKARIGNMLQSLTQKKLF
jgi:ABC-type nitrate/sulfonate/bicarbonate transport system ATPase subunit